MSHLPPPSRPGPPAVALLVALLLHLGGWRLATSLPARGSAEVRPAPAPVRWLAPAARAPRRPRALDPAAAQHSPPVARAPVEREPPTTGQVVDSAPDQTRPPDQPTSLLAERDSATDHPTRSRHARGDYRNVMRAPTAGATDGAAKPAARARAEPPGGQKTAAPGGGKAGDNAVALQLRPDHEGWGRPGGGHPPRPPGAGLSEGEAGDPGSEHAAVDAAPSLSLRDLIPAVDTLGQLAGGPTNDALADLDVADSTNLNAHHFKYASFFNRMKREVARHWQPGQEMGRRDPTGQIFGLASRRTMLRISLSAAGHLLENSVQQSSGLDFLDAAAQSAFARAEPFPNPPRGLLAGADQISFLFGFDFHYSL